MNLIDKLKEFAMGRIVESKATITPIATQTWKSLIREYISDTDNELDNWLFKSIIGSRILDIQIGKIPGKKTLYKVVIKTDAKPVPSPFVDNVFYHPEQLTFVMKL